MRNKSRIKTPGPLDPGKKLQERMCMATKKHWPFEIDGRAHAVDFKEGDISGKMELELDGSQVVQDTAGLLEAGKDLAFEVDGRPAVLRASYGLLGLLADYKLVVDGREIP